MTVFKLKSGFVLAIAFLVMWAAPVSAQTCKLPMGQYSHLFSDSYQSFYFNETHTLRVDQSGLWVIQPGDFEHTILGHTYTRQGDKFTFKTNMGSYNSSNGGDTIYFKPSGVLSAQLSMLPKGLSYENSLGKYVKQNSGQITYEPKIRRDDIVINAYNCNGSQASKAQGQLPALDTYNQQQKTIDNAQKIRQDAMNSAQDYRQNALGDQTGYVEKSLRQSGVTAPVNSEESSKLQSIIISSSSDRIINGSSEVSGAIILNASGDLIVTGDLTSRGSIVVNGSGDIGVNGTLHLYGTLVINGSGDVTAAKGIYKHGTGSIVVNGSGEVVGPVID
jgi:hypothetical protein